jgi:SAM-dependent methyltransferase
MSHPDLDSAAQARLVALTDTDAPADVPAVVEVPAPVPAKRWKRKMVDAARPVADPALDRLAALVAARIRHTMRSEYDELVANVELMRAEHAAMLHALDGVNAFGAGGAATRIDALETNGELMKAELAAFRSSLDGIGQAIAPAAGIAGVPARFAELREQLNALDRRVRAAAPVADAAPSTASPASAPAPEAAAASDATGGFDYVGFERRFRGDSDTVLDTLADRYATLLADHQPVLDFGCGRGELVDVLATRGIEATGVDPDAGMVAEAHGHGRRVVLGDGLEYLRQAPTNELGAVISVHVVEHLPLPVLVELLELAAARLRPGGVFIAETPNPTSLIVLGNSYILDPTHVWPLHPSLMTFLAERAGFRDVELRFYSPAEDYRLAAIDAGSDAPPWVADLNVSIERLNDVLFGPQEYAIVARTPPA